MKNHENKNGNLGEFTDGVWKDVAGREETDNKKRNPGDCPKCFASGNIIQGRPEEIGYVFSEKNRTRDMLFTLICPKCKHEWEPYAQ